MTVARHGTISDAARALGVTQPALSRRIQLLEEELGAELLVRSRKGVVLSEAGRIATAEGSGLVERYDRLRGDLRAHLELEAGRVQLGGGATAVSFLLPPAIARFQADHPGVRFRVKEAGSREIEDDVVAERLELGIVTLPVRGREVLVRPLRTDRIVAIASRDHPLTRRGRLSVRDLDGQGLVSFEAGSEIRRLIDDALRNAGAELDVVMELRSIPAILRMVATTRNLAFVSALGVGERDEAVRPLKLRGLAISRRLGIISKRGRPVSAAAAEFARELKR